MILIPVTGCEYHTEIRSLFLEYMGWVVDGANELWDLGWSKADVAAYVDEDLHTFGRLLPPNGRFYLAQLNGEIVGTGGIKQLNPTTGEIKRMYVRPKARRQGIAKRILEQLLADAHTLNYKTVYLDSPKFAQGSQKLYQSRGFRYLDGRYPGNENVEENDYMLNFMQLDL